MQNFFLLFSILLQFSTTLQQASIYQAKPSPGQIKHIKNHSYLNSSSIDSEESRINQFPFERTQEITSTKQPIRNFDEIFTELEPHEILEISFKIHVFNKLEAYDLITISIDNHEYSLTNFHSGFENPSFNTSDHSQHPFEIINSQISVSHSSDSVRISLAATTQGQGYITVKDLMFIGRAREIQNFEYSCFKAKSALKVIGTGPCMFSDQYYDPATNTCKRCSFSDREKNRDEDQKRILSALAGTKFFISPTIIELLQGVTFVVGTLGAAAGIGSTLVPIGIQLLPISRFIYNIRYIEFNFSEDMKDCFRNMNNSMTSLMMDYQFLDVDLELIKNQKVPSNYEGWGLSVNFLTNYFSNILSLIICVFLAAVFAIGDKLAQSHNKKNLGFLLEKIKNIFKWNLPLLILCSTLDIMILYADVEFRSGPSLKTLISQSGTLLCILFIIVSLVFIGLGANLTRKRYLAKSLLLSNPDDEERASEEKYVLEKFDQEWVGWRVLYAGLSEKKTLARSFTTFTLLKNGIWMLVHALISSPIIKTSLFCCLSLASIFYMIVIKPFADKISKFVIPAIEIISLFTFVNVFVLVIMNKDGSIDPSSLETLDSLIIYSSIGFTLMTFGLCMIQTIRTLITSFKVFRSLRRVSLALILSLPFLKTDKPPEIQLGSRDLVPATQSLVQRRKHRQATKSLTSLQQVPSEAESIKRIPANNRRLFTKLAKAFDGLKMGDNLESPRHSPRHIEGRRITILGRHYPSTNLDVGSLKTEEGMMSPPSREGNHEEAKITQEGLGIRIDSKPTEDKKSDSDGSVEMNV